MVQNIVLIDSSETAWPAFKNVIVLSFLGNLVHDIYVTFDNFKIGHKLCSILV